MAVACRRLGLNALAAPTRGTRGGPDHDTPSGPLAPMALARGAARVRLRRLRSSPRTAGWPPRRRCAWPRRATCKPASRCWPAGSPTTTQIEVSPTFGASGQLAEQIKAGAPFDVFLAANQTFVEDLAAGGFVRPESVRAYARGTLVLVVHRDAAEAIRSLADLTKPEVKKIALANPAFAPYGAAGKQALERAGLWVDRRAEGRPGRVGPPGVAVRPVGQRRGRAGRPARSPGSPRSASSRSTRISTTRSSRPWGSWRAPAAPRTPKRSPASSWVTRGRPSCYNPVSGNSDPLREPP